MVKMRSLGNGLGVVSGEKLPSSSRAVCVLFKQASSKNRLLDFVPVDANTLSTLLGLWSFRVKYEATKIHNSRRALD